MPRFSVAFSRRKSAATAEDFQDAQINTPEQSSFRVIERSELTNGKSFDGGARLARASGAPLPRPNTMVDLSMDDNIFADVKGNRGSGASNTTKATSTDTSSRHSNASTAPSSADLGANGHDEQRNARKPLHDIVSRAAPKSSPSSFLKSAGRTFSFGGQKKNTIPPPANNDPLPDVPAIPTIQQEDPYGRSRGMTTSTTSTATPPKLEGSNLDLGGDFGSMFSGFDKRASMATLKNDLSSSPTPAAPSNAGSQRSLTTTRQFQPAPLNLDSTTSVEPPMRSWNSQNSNDILLESKIPSPLADRPPPVPPHQVPQPSRSPSAPLDVIEDEDAMLLQETVAAGKFLSKAGGPGKRSEPIRYVLEERTGKNEDNMFDSSVSRVPLNTYKPPTKASGPPQSKVMTTEQFERYRKDKERHTPLAQDNQDQDDDDGDEINYDDDEDEAEKSKQQVKQRKKQEAHMAVYRQQMMKVTGEPTPSISTPSYRPGLPTSLSAPHLSQLKAPSPDHTTGVSDEDEDEEVPLAILQAHGFPAKNRPPTRLSVMGSNPNLRASMMIPPPGRPGSSMGETSSGATQRHSVLPAFARHLPQDPFVGASLAKPAVRESLSFGGGIPAGSSPQQSSPLPPGGLVGVIANEERSRAMRRGSPNIDNQKMMGTGAQGFDPIGGIPHQMMYGMGQQAPMGAMPGMPGMPGMAGMQGMPMMPQPMLTPGDQAQIQMTQQMQQFMQMQMQFMQMMTLNQSAQAQMMQQPYGNVGGSPSMADVSSRHSMVGEPLIEPRRLDAGMRTMSMIQPSSSSFIQQPGYAGSIRGGPAPGYTPSIAPSERSNVGLPGRYRPVSQAPAVALSPAAPAAPPQHQRASTMSGALSLPRWDDAKRKSTMNVVTKAGDGSDEDDEEGWENMKAKREKKRSIWKSKKSFSSDLSAMLK